MMSGVVSEGLEAIVRLRLRGPQGAEQEVAAVLDTGFTGALVVSPATAAALGLTLLDQEEIALADGSVIPVSRHEGAVSWDGQERAVMVHCLDGGPLIGMSLLRAQLLTIEVAAGGRVAIAAL